MSEHGHSEFPGSDWLSDILEVDEFDGYEASFENEGDEDIL